MKKRFVIAFLLIPILLFNSCSFFAPGLNDDTSEKADARLNQVIEAINNKDKDTMRAMFSKKALSEANDLEGRMNYIFDLVGDKIVKWETVVSGAIDESSDGGSVIKRTRSWYYAYTDKHKYLIFLLEYTIDTDHTDNVGLYMLQVIKAEDEDKEFDIGQKTLCAGIYMPPAPGDISAPSAVSTAAKS